MLTKDQVIDQINSSVEAITSQESLKKFLRCMAFHPYTDIMNVSVLMHGNQNVGVYSTIEKGVDGVSVSGLSFNYKISSFVVDEITYLNFPGPVFRREEVEQDFEIDSVSHDGEFKIVEEDSFATIYYPEAWDESQKTEALLKTLFNMFYPDHSAEGSDVVGTCVLYMMMTYAGFHAYLPSSTYRDLLECSDTLKTGLTMISIAYQEFFRRILGVVMTPLEMQFTHDYQSYSKIKENSILGIYKYGYERLFGDHYRDAFKRKPRYYPPVSCDYVLEDRDL